jgi:hypothetical protein
MLVGEDGAYPIVEQLKFTFTWVGSWPFLQTLDKDGKTCQGQTLVAYYENS